MSKLYIIAGPNGAGKTTASMEYLKDELDCLEFLNADNIAAGLSPFRPESVAITAGRLMLERMNDLLKQQIDFAIETTLSSSTLIEKLKFAKSLDYEVCLLFYYLDSADLAIKRVENRVANGGHNIPKDVIIRRYNRGLDNFFNKFRAKCNYWLFIDNSGINYEVIAEGNSETETINNKIIWNQLKVQYGK